MQEIKKQFCIREWGWIAAWLTLFIQVDFDVEIHECREKSQPQYIEKVNQKYHHGDQLRNSTKINQPESQP